MIYQNRGYYGSGIYHGKAVKWFIQLMEINKIDFKLYKNNYIFDNEFEQDNSNLQKSMDEAYKSGYH